MDRPMLNYETIKPRQMSRLAVAATVCGIISLPLGLIGIGVILGPLAVIFGWVALGRIRRSPVELGGVAFAVAGIVIGAGGLVLSMVMLVLLVRQFMR